MKSKGTCSKARGRTSTVNRPRARLLSVTHLRRLTRAFLWRKRHRRPVLARRSGQPMAVAGQIYDALAPARNAPLASDTQLASALEAPKIGQGVVGFK